MSLVEAAANVVVLVQIVPFPMLGIKVDIAEDLAIGLVFTSVSIVRSYLLRRLSEAAR